MPCNSDYLEPSNYEVKIKEVVDLLFYVKEKVKIDNNELFNSMKENKDQIYFNQKLGDYFVTNLCEIISNLSEDKYKKLVYNAKDKNSRLLANWWEEHLEADKQRIKEEKRLLKEIKDKEKALNKLTARERKLLGHK